MLNKINYFILVLLFSTFIFPSVDAGSLEDLLNSYSFNYFGDSIDVSGVNDSIIDTDSNSVGDTLIFNISTHNSTSGSYTFYIDLFDNRKIVTGKTIATVPASSFSLLTNISTKGLSKNSFNYSLRVYDSNNKLVYRIDKLSTANYASYDRYYTIVSLTDSNINDDLIRINITLNSSISSTENVSISMAYEDRFISSTKQVSLNNGTNSISLDFDNETIKLTHYNGTFLISYVTLGNNRLFTNYTTNNYNFETFAKTSYIKDFKDYLIDLNMNNLTDYLQINTTITAKTTGAHTFGGDIYDLEGNYLFNISKSQSLSIGNNIVSINLNGSEIYKSKFNGPFKILFAKLTLSGNTLDKIDDAYTTNISSYLEYERSLLPDLKIDMVKTYNGSTNLLNLTVLNIGTSPAFNIIVDLFGNSTNKSQQIHPSLNVSENKTFTFSAIGGINDLYVGAVDMMNIIDEINDSNNIVRSYSLTSAVPNDTNRFIIQNNSGSNVSWLGDWGNIALKGTCFISSNCVAPSGSLVISNSTDNSTAYMDPSGNLCLESGSCSAQSGSCNPTIDSFLIQNTTGYNMSYISSNGNLCLTGGLYQNVQL